MAWKIHVNSCTDQEGFWLSDTSGAATSKQGYWDCTILMVAALTQLTRYPPHQTTTRSSSSDTFCFCQQPGGSQPGEGLATTTVRSAHHGTWHMPLLPAVTASAIHAQDVAGILAKLPTTGQFVQHVYALLDAGQHP